MDDRRDHPSRRRDREASDGPAAAEPAGAEAAGGGSVPDAHDDLDVLLDELARVREELELARSELAAAEDRALRARAELENLRRRQQGELERARQQGQDGALRSVLTVHDDLERALTAADQSDDPATIVPGVEAVLAGLLRQLEALGLEPTGAVGEPFDANLHEAVMAVPPAQAGQAGTIHEVYEVGFVQGERLVRPARVVVYQEA